MPLEKRPANPIPPGYVPVGSKPYKVKTSDDWYSVARAHGVSPQDLIYFNFKTHDPREVNYYLRANVGCVKPTHDHNNWMFSSEAYPGIIYIPLGDWKRPSFPPAPQPAAPEPKPEKSGIWFGIGFQGGGHLAVAGKDTVEAWMFSLETYKNRFMLNVDGYRIGPGLGGSVGVAVVVATGGTYPSSFNGLKVSGWDFQANLAGKWGDLAKGVKGLGAVKRFANAGKIVDKMISYAEWEKIRDLIWNGIKAGSINPHSEKPEVNVMAIPGAGVGLEISGYYGFGDVFVHGATLGAD